MKFTYSDELPEGKVFLTAQIAGHEVVCSVILPQPELPFSREGAESHFEHGTDLTSTVAEAHTFRIQKTQPSRTSRVRRGTQGTIRAIAFRETSRVRQEVQMKKLMFSSFALALAISLVALAQNANKAAQTKQETAKTEKAPVKAVAVTGKVSADAKTFVDKDNKSWTVTNPEALKGHEGHEVTLKAHVDAAKNEIHVVSVKMGKDEMKETTKKEEKK